LPPPPPTFHTNKPPQKTIAHSVRTLYEKYLEWDPSNAEAWLSFAELEAALGERERARALFELAVAQAVLDAPERVWRAYVEFECARRERARARVLYERLLDRTSHVKVWLSYARFEQLPLPAEEDADEEEEGEGGEGGRRAEQQQQHEQRNGGGGDVDDNDESMAPAACDRRLARARAVFERGFRALREAAGAGGREGGGGAANGEGAAAAASAASAAKKHAAVLLLDAWRAAEAGAAREWGRAQADVDAAVAALDAKAPRRVKRKRAAAAGQPPEEYWDLAFPDEASAAPSLRLLEAAQRWKRQKQQQQQQEQQMQQQQHQELVQQQQQQERQQEQAAGGE